MSKEISTESYKGVRDFYPEDQAIQNHIFKVWREVSEKFGYEEYNASVLEPAELYRAKSGEEIVNEQTYTFTDRGEREVTLRPEMTPTVARMIAHRRRELPTPVRWYSIPNLFRYEKPQKGRLREHWQLNVDIFGISSIEAEIEVIALASGIMRGFGLEQDKYEIRINSRKVMNFVLREAYGFKEDVAHKLGKLIDRKAKMYHEDFEKEIKALTGDKSQEFITLLNSKNLDDFANIIGAKGTSHESIKEVRDLITRLEDLGIGNAVFDQTLMRGFDYYTGIVFEIYDINPENRRSLFGGGRYDDLLSIFGEEKVPAFGFGMGDVTIRDTLETYKLLPTSKPAADITLCVMTDKVAPYAQDLAQKLRSEGAKVLVDISGKKIGDQIKNADKRHVPFIVVVGEDEIKGKKFKIKHLKTGKEIEVTEDNLIEALTLKTDN